MPDDDRGQAYSRAFEKLVENRDDLPGLIAYALYKQAIREAVATGRMVHPSEHRSPTPTEIETYRNSAGRLLSSFAAYVVDQERERIIETALRADIAKVETNLVSQIKTATAWRSAILTNLLAWLISIAITFLVLFAGGPTWIQALIEWRGKTS